MENAMGNVTRGLLLSAYQHPCSETNDVKQQSHRWVIKNQTYDECIFPTTWIRSFLKYKLDYSGLAGVLEKNLHVSPARIASKPLNR